MEEKQNKTVLVTLVESVPTTYNGGATVKKSTAIFEAIV